MVAKANTNRPYFLMDSDAAVRNGLGLSGAEPAKHFKHNFPPWSQGSAFQKSGIVVVSLAIPLCRESGLWGYRMACFNDTTTEIWIYSMQLQSLPLHTHFISGVPTQYVPTQYVPLDSEQVIVYTDTRPLCFYVRNVASETRWYQTFHTFFLTTLPLNMYMTTMAGCLKAGSCKYLH